MQVSLRPDSARRSRVALGVGLRGCVVLIWVILAGCHRPPKPKSAEQSQQPQRQGETNATGDATPAQPLRTANVYATWYDVPANSTARRRAGPQEFTAAHNHLPLGTRVRVTHLGNGRSAIVRITDRGIPGRNVKLDLCKEAAEQLDMLREGRAKVRMEIFPREEEAAKSSQPGSP